MVYPFNVTEMKTISVPPEILTATFKIQNNKCKLSMKIQILRGIIKYKA